MLEKKHYTEEAELFVPGRICLFGEHSDWAAEHGLHPGYCLITGTDQGLCAVARPADCFIVETLVPDKYGRPSGRSRQMVCEWRNDALMAAAEDENEFFRYCAGTAHQMLFCHRDIGGIELRITAMDLPLGKGVSSSAAVCILVAEAFSEVYGLNMFPHELMEVAYVGEKLTGSQCGRMDQACIYGKTPVLLTCRKAFETRIEPIFPTDEICMFFVDLAGKKDTVKILGDLQTAYLKTSDLRKALGPINEQIARRAFAILRKGSAEQLGELMTEAQENFDTFVAPHCVELTAPLLHELLVFEDIAPHIHGGKGVGSQGDGTVQFVARSRDDRDTAMARIVEAFPEMQCFPLTIAPHMNVTHGEL